MNINSISLVAMCLWPSYTFFCPSVHTIASHCCEYATMGWPHDPKTPLYDRDPRRIRWHPAPTTCPSHCCNPIKTQTELEQNRKSKSHTAHTHNVKILFQFGISVLYSVCVCSRELTNSSTQNGSDLPPKSADAKPVAPNTFTVKWPISRIFCMAFVHR